MIYILFSWLQRFCTYLLYFLWLVWLIFCCPRLILSSIREYFSFRESSCINKFEYKLTTAMQEWTKLALSIGKLSNYSWGWERILYFIDLLLFSLQCLCCIQPCLLQCFTSCGKALTEAPVVVFRLRPVAMKQNWDKMNT